MKKIILTTLLILFTTAAYAASINPVAYRQMQMQQYQRSRYQQQRAKQIPYWQAQSNYTTRNKIYNNYGNTQYNYSRNSNNSNYYRSQW